MSSSPRHASAFPLLEEALKALSPADIAGRIGLHPNTVIRWLERREAPRHYRMDFLRILNRPVTADAATTRELDQFFTKKAVAAKCFRVFEREAKALGVDLAKYHHIEPSAGEGCFTDLLPKGRRTALDLVSRRKDIIQTDFLAWTPPAGGKYVVVGNPPFGLRGHTALRFVNHAANFADIVAFILPQLFESDGKGAPMKRVDPRLKLARSGWLEPESFEFPGGAPASISTVFQVWTKVGHDRVSKSPAPTCASFIKVYSLSDGGTPASTRNKAMLDKCDIYLPSTCYEGMRAYDSFAELPNKRGYGVVILRNKREIGKLLRRCDWAKAAFSSTNGALNLRGSLIRRVVTDGGFCDDQREIL